MRISDDRYDRDRMRFDLALRMMRHGARQRTIRAWTGVSDDRLRKLYRTYCVRRAARQLYRLRARLPVRASCFLKSSALGFEATTLACVFYILGLLDQEITPRRETSEISTLKRALTFCQAYELYRVLYPAARLYFEHAWFLLTALTTQDGVKLTACGNCERFYLTELARLDAAHCGCGPRKLGLPRHRRLTPPTRPAQGSLPLA